MNHHPSSDSFGKIMEKQEYWQRKQFSERATVLCISCSSATMEEMSIITEGGRGPVSYTHLTLPTTDRV